MPNHCMNYLDVKGSFKNVLKFVEETHKIIEHDSGSKHYTLSFEKILPTPIKENGEIIDEWYDWRLKHWGTKWDLYDDYGGFIAGDRTEILTDNEEYNLKTLLELKVEDEVDTQYYLTFCTAWCPPMEMYYHLMEKYKELDMTFRASYDEGGCGFAGHIEFKQGEIIEEEFYDIGDDPVSYYEYLLENGIEDIEYMLEIIRDQIDENHENESEEFRDKLYNKIEEVMTNKDVSNKNKANLYVQILYEKPVEK